MYIYVYLWWGRSVINQKKMVIKAFDHLIECGVVFEEQEEYFSKDLPVLLEKLEAIEMDRLSFVKQCLNMLIKNKDKISTDSPLGPMQRQLEDAVCILTLVTLITLM